MVDNYADYMTETPMPFVTAPYSDSYMDSDNGIRVLAPTLIHGDTLGEILKAFDEKFGVKIFPYDGSLPDVPFIIGEPPKYFCYQNSRRINDGLVDIHIIRAGETICPKQNLTFSIHEDDQIVIGHLVC